MQFKLKKMAPIYSSLLLALIDSYYHSHPRMNAALPLSSLLRQRRSTCSRTRLGLASFHDDVRVAFWQRRGALWYRDRIPRQSIKRRDIATAELFDPGECMGFTAKISDYSLLPSSEIERNQFKISSGSI